ncbi:hypothetical protein GOP47_0006180 [Adiantum capillus-veneris]|uniref:Thioesterase domain-containing protein n=1 Tax=Adiantum capillus-veneris TaxID=13818 RepID=A0A9D4V2E8_ADICA|nr:hypothetical protein GOP47_0006180 [Adiantum capillus-veneris]
MFPSQKNTSTIMACSFALLSLCLELICLCVQPFGVLHGGVSALIAEALASSGAFFASGHQRVAGVQLTINHVKAASIGTEVLASAKPVHVGQRTQVWDVILSKDDTSASNSTQGTRIALARVTLMVDPLGPVVKVDKQGRPLARL